LVTWSCSERRPTSPTRQPPRTAGKVGPCSAPVGLRDWVEHGYKQVKGGLSVEKLYASLARTKLRRRPGERVKYSNLSAGLPGQALARAARQPYERIWLPLGMPDTIITPSDQQRTRLAGAGALPSTLLPPRWPLSLSAASFPSSGWPGIWRSGLAG
jgi:CubicO group peptidase (beta-lactamase class C family)